jgi:hypothetical protein
LVIGYDFSIYQGIVYADDAWDFDNDVVTKDLTLAAKWTPWGVGIKPVNDNEIRIISTGNQITITSGIEMQSVKLYDLQGRTIVSEQGISASVYSITSPGKGAYIIETQTNGVRNVQKIMVR